MTQTDKNASVSKWPRALHYINITSQFVIAIMLVVLVTALLWWRQNILVEHARAIGNLQSQVREFEVRQQLLDKKLSGRLDDLERWRLDELSRKEGVK
jgi:hypothetical protein